MSHAHRIEIGPDDRIVRVYRVFSDPRRDHFLTEFELPELPGPVTNAKLKELAALVGEIVLMDSPVARRILRI